MTEQVGHSHQAGAEPIGRSRMVLTTALWLACACGLFEGSLWLVRQQILGQVLRISTQVLWMAPLANVIWIGVPGLVLALALRVWPSQRLWRFSLFFLLFIASLTLVLLIASMNRAVAVLLAAGVGYRISRIAIAHPLGFARLIRRSLPALAGVVIVLGLGIDGYRWWQEKRARAGLTAADPNAPNILLIILDTVREQNLSAYGYERPTTPVLEAFAAEGTRFDLAIATAPWTLPSHASIFTGRLPREVDARLNERFKSNFPVISEAFASRGYLTGGFVANMSYCTRDLGLNRGFHHYEDYATTVSTVVYFSRLGRVLMEHQKLRQLIGFHDLLWRKNADRVTDGFLHWQRSLNGRPFMAFLNYFDAHQPYVPPEPHRSNFTTIRNQGFLPRDVNSEYTQMTAEEIRWSEEQYDGALAYQDQVLGHLFASLAERGVLDNTLVIVTSDHGEHFGDHERISHGNSLYRQLLEVPLILRFPGRVPAGHMVPDPVSLADLPRTMFDLTGQDVSMHFPGKSLARYFYPDSGAQRGQVIVSEMPARQELHATSLMDSDYHYIKWFGRPAQLFSIRDDPLEEHDLATLPAVAGQMARFDSLLTVAGTESSVPPRKSD